MVGNPNLREHELQKVVSKIMAGRGSRRYSLRSQGSNQALPRRDKTTEKTSGVWSSKPLFEAFHIGAWWDVEVVEKMGANYLVHFEGFGRHEEEVLTPASIRLRSRKAENSDCPRLIVGVDVAAYLIHPHALTSGSSMSLYSAWYDVKIMDKEYKHYRCTCACKFRVKVYGGFSENVESEKMSVMLEGMDLDMTIGKLGIMQVPCDLPLESTIQESLSLSGRRVKRLWSKDIFTLNLDGILQEPSAPIIKNGDMETNAENAMIHEVLTSCSDNGVSEEECTEKDSSASTKGIKRARTSLDQNADVIIENKDAEIQSSSEESSSSYMYSSTDSSTEESYDSVNTYDQEHATDHSLSTCTPVFYGTMDEDESKTTSTRTFYGNTGSNSNSTEVFYGSLKKAEGTSVSECNVKSNCDKRSRCQCENMQISSDWSDSIPCKACKLLEVESSPTMSMPSTLQNENLGKGQMPTSFLNESLCNKEVPTSFQKETLNKAQVQNVSVKAPAYCAVEIDTISANSEHPLRRKGEIKGVQHKQKPKSGQEEPTSVKNKEGQSRKFFCQSNVASPCNQGGARFSKVSKGGEYFTDLFEKILKRKEGQPKKAAPQSKGAFRRNRGGVRSSMANEGRQYFNDLFDRILSSVQELQQVKRTMPSEKMVSSPEARENQVSWDPRIFHEKEESHSNLKSVPKDIHLKYVWRDMELALEEMEMFDKGPSMPMQRHDQWLDGKALECEHTVVLNEEEGYICSLCGLLIISIENIAPPVHEDKVHRYDHDNKTESEGDAFEAAFDANKEHDVISKIPLQVNIESMWELIPDLRASMQKNQVDGFDFLWENIGALSSRNDTKGGGCIIAHAPGTGKSLLIISFLKSFLILNSWCRPLIVAPKNMLLSWQKEFEKWKSDIKVYLLQSSLATPLKYLAIISEWQKNTSVLIVTYQLFALLTDEDRACRNPQHRVLGSLLLHIPDILILDEGHVPRNCSKLRYSVMQVRTRFKILVSGTLFQNNLQELFNLFYLARPNFLKYLGLHFGNNRMEDFDTVGAGKQWQSFEDFERVRWEQTTEDDAESSSRKIFMDAIGNKLEMNVDENEGAEFKEAMAKLHAITSPFVHFYDGEILKTLPGINESIIVLQATELQVSLSTKIKQQDYLETSLHVHPSILLKWKGARSWTFLDADKLNALRMDPLPGPKVKFILDLAECCHAVEEKLLIFSQYIPTLEHVAEMLQKKFKVVMIKGSYRLDERQRTIDTFNNSEGTSILLASITACGEGINLTGASRVVFLDMHWNPARMKQAIARAYRIGQRRIVYTYWLMASLEKEADKFTRIQKKDFLSRSIFSSGGVQEAQEGQFEEGGILDVRGEDSMLEQVVKKDMGKAILKVIKYSALERGVLPAFFEQHNTSGR